MGALLLRRDVTCVLAMHGGGQERDIRSAHPMSPVRIWNGDSRRSRWTDSRKTARGYGCWDRLVEGVLTRLTMFALTAPMTRCG